MATNYKQLFAIQSKLEKQLKLACPNISHKSGIYFLIRKDEDKGEKYAYIGKGVDVLRRMCSHLQGYQQRIDISLKKRGFFSNQNLGGWELNVLYFPKEQLDNQERHFIEAYRENGFILYNVESGGTTGKEIIGERKPVKNYTDGLKQGKKKTVEQVRTYFAKYLDYTIKPPTNKIKERKAEEFEKFLQVEENNDK